MDRALGRFLAVLVLVWAVNLPAQTVVELGGVSNDGGAFVNFGIADSSNNEKVAMPLTLSGPAAISKVVVQLTKVGNPTDNVVIEVRQGSPDGALLASSSIGGSNISASGSRHELTVPVFVVPSGSISVVYSRSGASNPSNFFKAVRGTSGSVYGAVSSGGYMYLKTGAGWAGSDLYNAIIVSLWGTTVSMGQVNVSPGASISFGDVNVGQVVQQLFRIRNIGTAALTVTGVSSNNTAFTLSPVIPPSVGVNVGDSAAVTVSFSPVAVGAVSGNITITHNGVNSPTVMAVSGNGVTSGGGSSGGDSGGSPPPSPSPPVPGITLLPSSLVMDSVSVGGPGSHKTFEIRNDSSLTLNISNVTVSGTNAGEFLVNFGVSAIEAGGKRIAVVSFFPATAGAKLATINIFHNAPGGVSTVPLSGVANPFVPGTSGSAISITPQSINFDTVGVGSSRTLNLTVSNPGSAVLTISGIVVAGVNPADFSLSRTNLSVEPGQERFINITFTPASVGPKTATLVLANNTASPAVTVSLSGTTPVFFATPRVNISVDRREGPAPLTVRFSNVNSGGQANYWEWLPGDRGEVSLVTVVKRENGDTLTYVYSQPGVYRPKLALFGPGGGDAQYLADSILVLAPQPPRAVLRVDSDSLQFGAISVGGGIVSSFRVFNTGAAELHGRVALNGDNSFNVTSGDSLHIPVGSEGRTISIRFVPLSAGAKNGRLIVNYNGDSKEIILSGEGTSAAVDLTTVAPGPRLVASVTQADLGDIFVARDTSYVMIPVRNSGDAVLTGWWFLDAASDDFSVDIDSTSLSPGASDTVTVSFIPRAEGEKTGRLYFFHNASIQSFVITLAGTGKVFVVSVEMADFDGSGTVDLGDFFMFSDHFGQPLSPEEIEIFDLNGDGRVDNDDFFIFSDFFGRRVE